MNINEIEKLTGISKQNIRFYESKDLLKPKRNKNNGYREYDEDDVKDLEKIKLFRLLGFSIEQISLMQQTGEIPNIEEHIQSLKNHIKNIEGSIAICEELKGETLLDDLDPQKYLNLVATKEKDGCRFVSIIDDYKHYLKLRYLKKFSFLPDNMCMTKEEFTDSLLAYAKKKKRDITIVKESMYPEFILDGHLYTADRVIGRYGAVVRCQLKDDSELPEFITTKKRKLQVLLLYYLPALIIIAVLGWILFARDGDFWLILLMGIGFVSIFIAYGIYWFHMDD